MHRVFILAVATVLIPGSIPVHAQTKGDAAVGLMTFRQCSTCHSITPHENLPGPSLAGIFGRHAAQLAEFTYSKALKSANITWTEVSLNQYLENPHQIIDGGHSTFIGVRNSADRDDIIAYLKALK